MVVLAIALGVFGGYWLDELYIFVTGTITDFRNGFNAWNNVPKSDLEIAQGL